MLKNELQIQATLELEIAPDGQEAHALIKSSKSGESWSAGRIIEHLSSLKITETIPRDEIDKKLKLLGSDKEQSLRLRVAHGTKPRPPSPEKPEWFIQPIPEELASVATMAIAGAGTPEISVEIVEKVKRTKTVTRKGALPFLPSRQEVVEVVERVTRPQRVYVDPTVEGQGWTEAEQKIAGIIPSDFGVPGKDIYGNPAPAVALPDANFYAGRNVTRKRDELIADCAGFVRYGTNWVEVIPLVLHSYTVRLSDDKATCYLTFTPGSIEAPAPAASAVIDAAGALNYLQTSLLAASEIDAMISDSISRAQPLSDVPISINQDAQVSISMSEDKLKLFLNLRKGRGNGTPLRMRDIGSAITGSGIKSFDKVRLQKDISTFYRSAEEQLTNYLVAEGKEPRKGSDSVVQLTARPYDDKTVKELISRLQSAMSGNGVPASLREEFPPQLIQSIASVQKDQRILSHSQPTAGEAGINVFGEPIPGILGRKTSFRLFENVAEAPNVVIATEDGILDIGQTEDGTYLFRVRQDRDAEVQIRITADRMLAVARITEHTGSGKPADEAALREALAASGVSSGIDDAAIRGVIARAAAGEEVDEEVVARGDMPVRPGQRTLRFLVPIASNRGVTIRGDGTADYRNQDRLTQITAGEEIVEIAPPQSMPRDGFDVTGAVIPSGMATGPEIDLGANVTQSLRPDGTMVIVARVSGELIYDRNRISIRPSHLIRGDVDLKTGNVRFQGPVTVTGTVRSGFFVVSEGEIRIGGGVEAALLSSSENIVVRQGVSGAGKAVLRTKKNITVAFCEQATLLSVGDIMIAASCMHSRVKCNGRLVLSPEKGSLIGGQIQARNGVETLNVGSERSVRTHISFGQNYLISDHIEAESKEIEKLKEQIVKVESLIRNNEQSGAVARLRQSDTPKDNAALYQEKSRILRTIEKRNMRIFMFREKFEEHFESAVKVRGTIFPGTVLESHGRSLEISTARKNVQFVFNTTAGRIEERPLSDR